MFAKFFEKVFFDPIPNVKSGQTVHAYIEYYEVVENGKVIATGKIISAEEHERQHYNTHRD